MSEIYDVYGNTIAIGSGGSEDAAKEKLTGKVLVALGDSFTVGMSNQLTSLATKYGMAVDNRGVVSSTLSDRTSIPQSMYDRADDIVDDYTFGKTINGTTYYADDVGILTLMGGANDGAGIDRWIGDGIHVTDPNTIYGSLHHILSEFLETFTKATVICITQPSIFNSVVATECATDEDAQNRGFTNRAEALVLNDIQFSNYCMGMKQSAVRTCAWYYQVPLLDMFNEFPAVNDPANRSKYWQNDKVHLTTDGYNFVAGAIDKKIIELFGQ